MEERKFQNKWRYLLAFIIGTILFILGFIIVNSISYLEYQRISNSQENTAYGIFEDKLSYSFFDQDICSIESFKKISEDLGFQGRIIDDLERKFGKNDERVLFRKKFYTLILLEHFEFVNLRNEKCNSKINTILFFYSNDDKYIKESEDLGRLLGKVYENNDNIVIYSFDVDLDSVLIESLKEKYLIQEPLELLINQNTKIKDIKNINDIEKYLNN